jgi:light-regulated signal transduction histidine kinase (bacteriophytochrome)
VQQALAAVHQEGDDRRVELATGDLPHCQAAPELLKQVFVHLLDNALKFTRGREVAHIEVGCRDIDGAHIHYVRDNGVDSDVQYAHQLSGVFQRLHHAEDFPGGGIGLAQRIVQRHGGRIWAEGAVDQGTTFSFMLGGVGMAVPGQDRRPLDTQVRGAEA